MIPQESNRAPQGALKAAPGMWGGFFSSLKGLKFMLRHKGLLPLALIPLAINIVLYSMVFWVSLKYFNVWLDRLIPQAEAWYWVALIYLLTVLVIIFLLVIIALTFTIVANILASPFNDSLSAKTEEIVTGKTQGSFSLREVIRETGRTIREEVKKLVFYLVVVGALLTLNLVPVVGSVVYTVLFSLLTVLWLGLSFLDYALARNGYRLGGKLRFVRQYPMATFGYGLGIFVFFLVPLLNLILIPPAVVGGTLLYLELIGGRGTEPEGAEIPPQGSPEEASA